MFEHKRLLAAGSLSDRTDDGTVSGHVVSILGLISAVTRVEWSIDFKHRITSRRTAILWAILARIGGQTQEVGGASAIARAALTADSML